MPKKSFYSEAVGDVIITKRRASRNIRIRVKSDNTVHVSIPLWSSYRAGLFFVKEKQDWIKQQQSKTEHFALSDGLRIGKTHRITLHGSSSERTRTRITGNELRVYVPQGLTPSSPQVTSVTEKAITKLLKKEACQLLEQRLQSISEHTGYSYSSLRIGNMKTRWGSCSSAKQITLNCYLMQLPWHLIDYVILHELVHTEVMSHGPQFWTELAKHLPEYKEVKKELKDHSPNMHLA